MSWTEERVELLKRYWADGHTASEIAAKLGGTTRNAVIGKVHRLGLGGRRKEISRIGGGKGNKHLPGRAPQHSPPHNKKTRHRLDASTHQTTDLDAINQEFDKNRLAQGALTIAQLDRHHCRFPIGDPSTPDLRYCGADRLPGLPYCQHHADRAYQPPKARSRPINKNNTVLPNRAKLSQPA